MSATNTDKFRAQLVQLYDVRDNDDAILAAATKGTGALAALGELMKKFGATDPGDLATKASAARDDAAKTAEFATKLTEALSALDANVEEEAKAETEQVAASAGFPAATDPKGKAARTVILAQSLEARRAALGIVHGADGKLTLGAKDPSKLAAFRTNYPVASQRDVLLSTPIVAGNGSQLGGPHTGLSGPGVAKTLPAHLQELQGYPGANDVAKAIVLLSDKRPGFSRQPWGEQNRIADEYVRTGKI